MTRRGCIAACLLVALTWNACALAQNCDKPGGVPEMTECATLRLRAAEREMANYYGILLDSEDKDFAKAVREAQEAWMRWREAEAKLVERTVNDPGLVLYTRRTQEAQMTEDRVKDLRSLAGN
ncbi:MAG: hypothetical protein FD177_1759 [Desulfovibrionaceae bacterium]|nr:MAG: hypothetical protein FD177_1759 [Desulfovibrionaceae bacterium]